MILATDGTVKPVNENIETLLSPEDLKYYRAHREEIEDILNAEWRSSKLSAKDAVEKHKALKEGVWSTGTVFQIQNFLRDIKKIKTHYYDIVGSDDVFNGLDQAESAAEEMMMNAPENRSDITEDEEPTSAELKKKDSVATISNKLQKLTAKMKKKAKEFKEAEGKAKDKIKDELKDMTAEKKKLEKSL